MMSIFEATNPIGPPAGDGGGLKPETALSDRARGFVEHWKALKPAPGRLPGRAQFDPVQAKRFLSGIWLVETVDESGEIPTPQGPRFRCRLYSAHLADVFGRDLTGMLLDKPEHGFKDTEAERDFRRVVTDGTPRWWRGPVVMDTPRFPKHVEVVMLPLAADGVRVDMILCFAEPI
jgi:hypothetical protein